jgi:tetratricopeptide (TPR) repeat protein
MRDPPDRCAIPARRLEELCAAWRSAFDRISDDVLEGRQLLDEALADADSEDVHARTLAELSGVRSRGDASIAALADLIHRVEELEAEWRAARRYEHDVLARRAADLAAKVAADSDNGAQEWLSEVFDALDEFEWEAAEFLAQRELAWPEELDAGARRIRTGVARWRGGDHAAGLELMELLGRARLDGWEEVLTLELRSRAHRLAAWVSLRRLKEVALAEQHLGMAIELWPYAGRMHAERAGYYLSLGELARAATDAQRAVELAKDDAAGYLELGIWAELSGDFEDADEFYRKALELVPKFDVARLGTRVSLIDPPGRLLIHAAEVLLEARRPRDALKIADQALQADMRGSELHPQAAAHRLRSLALEQLADRSGHEAAAAAVEAGKLYVWNGDLGMAIKQFERAGALDDAIEDLGWLLADAMLTTSLPLGRIVPDQRAVKRARDTWERWSAKVGPPSADTSWAYLTRAMIADLGTQRPGADRLAGVWEALLYVEKAIVHDRVDAQRWGYAAQYLSYVHLDELAFEAADRGYKLGAGDRQVLAQRLSQLGNRGRFEEAEQVAEELVTMFGNDPGISAARAWLALHGDREGRYRDALGLLALPLAEGNDPSWYYDMRALCHVALQDVDAAREDLRELLKHAPPVDGTTKCRLAMAAVAVADAEQAAHWSDEASKDPTARAITCLLADAFAAFARDDLSAAVELLSRATGSATSVIELRDIVETMRLRLALLAAEGDVAVARERAVRAVAAGPVVEREQWLAANPPDPGQELEEALATYAERETTPRLIRTALLAVKARRAVQAQRFGDAAASYEELLASSFEPEATLGLSRALRGLVVERAAVGEVEHVRQLMARMTALGGAGPAEAATAVAAALERCGRYRDAREQLETAIAMASDAPERAKLHQRAGGLALADDDLDRASSHFAAALETARAYDAHGRIGQVQIRLALVAIRRSDLAAARTHLLAAVRAWADGGALDPAAALVGELRGLQRSSAGGLQDAAHEALAIAERVAAPNAAGEGL